MTLPLTFRRQALRAAVKIHAHLVGPFRQAQPPGLPQANWDELCRAAQQYQYCTAKGWQAAASSVRQEMHYTALLIQREMEALRQRITSQASLQPVAIPGEIANDLVSLADEFEDFALDLRQQTISAVTPAIELEAVALGSFQIVLTWPRIGPGVAYECRALEPSRPSDHDGVTHPHVLDHRLCEGDGAAAVKMALATGRFLDFFVLVRQVLSTSRRARMSPSIGMGRSRVTGAVSA